MEIITDEMDNVKKMVFWGRGVSVRFELGEPGVCRVKTSKPRRLERKMSTFRAGSYDICDQTILDFYRPLGSCPRNV